MLVPACIIIRCVCGDQVGKKEAILLCCTHPGMNNTWQGGKEVERKQLTKGFLKRSYSRCRFQDPRAAGKSRFGFLEQSLLPGVLVKLSLTWLHCDSPAACCSPYLPPAAALRGNEHNKTTPKHCMKNKILMVVEDGAECPDPH